MKTFSKAIIIGLAMLCAFVGFAMADTGVPAVPEHQGISTTTIATVNGLVMESDSTAMTLTNNPNVIHTLTSPVGINTPIWVGNPFALNAFNQGVTQLTAAGGSINWHVGPFGVVVVDSMSVPDALLTQPIINGGAMTWGTLYAMLQAIPGVTATNVNQGLHTGMLNAGEAQYSTTYGLDIVAQNGYTVMQKTNKITTENTLPGQANLDMPLSFTFVATADGGNVVGDEDIMVEGAARAQQTTNVMTCPFGPTTTSVIPPFCNIVQAGGDFDLTVGSVTTNANDRFIQTDATNPVTLNYEISVKPYGQTPAYGSASAYYSAHIQEGRTASNTMSEDVTSSEHTSVSGVINGFTKKISYQSGPKLV